MPRIRSYLAASCSGAVVGLVVLFALFGQTAPVATGDHDPTERRRRRPVRVERAERTHARAADAPKARAPQAKARSRTSARPPDRLAIFRGLGAWVDGYDFALNPRATVATMRRHGVRTLYLQTGHSFARSAVDRRVGPWLVAAHRAGIEVVGWYLPSYRNWSKDVSRTVAIARYRYAGHRFDGIGIDIENKSQVRRRSLWNRRVATHARAVRRAVGSRYPVAAVPPPPLQMRISPSTWAGFPWRSLGRSTDAMVLMSYWSMRSGCPRVRHHCPFEFTVLNIRMTRQLMGKPGLLVHVAGGVADGISGGELRAFVRGARAGGADGASLYDVATTRAGWWRALSQLRDLR